MKKPSIASRIDHTILKADTTKEDIEKLCSEAKELGCAAVCVPPYYVSLAANLLAESGVKVATVAGFPLGYSHLAVKVREVEEALQDGADEIDVVMNIAAVKNGHFAVLQSEITACLKPVRRAGKVLKVILETCLLTDEEIVQCCRMLGELGVDFAKTSTGFSSGGATVAAVKLMRASLPEEVKIKAAGGIRDLGFARALVAAGAERLGCSGTVGIVGEEDGRCLKKI